MIVPYINFVYFFLNIYILLVIGQPNVQYLSNINVYSDASTQEAAVRDLITRVIGQRGDEFHVRVNEHLKLHGRDAFKIFKNASSDVEIEGSSGVAAAWGFHHYLKHFCHCHISWDDYQLSLPPSLPPVDQHIIANDRFRYYQNVCTSSYSFVWRDWRQWERHLDWMALNGINIALAFNAQEAIWKRVYTKYNLTREEINEHFTGPAFFAWGRMGNIRGWGGPLSDAWHNDSLLLQRLILSRMRSLGIIPVLPAFAGYVPRAFKRVFPNANFTKAGRWNDFEDKYCCPYLVSPDDPLFQEIGASFITEMVKEFGTNHIYNCDTFNEMVPDSGDLNYLKKIGQSIFHSMTKIDPKAIWLMQGWLFHNEKWFWTNERAEALLTSVPIGRMIVLDLMSEVNPQYQRLDSYFGQPYIWCMLHNFGGTLGMHGTVKRVNENTFDSRQAVNSSMLGIGLTMEGIGQNYVVYDLMLEMGWRKHPANLSNWVSEYSGRRYGVHNNHLVRMWRLLKDSVYNYQGASEKHGNFIVVSHPNLKLTPDIWYNVSYVMEAWDECLIAVKSIPSLVEVKTFKRDLVDLTRQALQLKIDFMYEHVVKAFKVQNINDLRNATHIFLDIMKDMNIILASNKLFLLGPWLESAKSKASSPEERNQFEEMARNQLTLWGPNGEILDYACKQWANLMSSYYFPRWKYFFEELIASVKNETKFNQTAFDEAVFVSVEKPFTFSKEIYPTYEIGDSYNISVELHKKWRNLETDYKYTKVHLIK